MISLDIGNDYIHILDIQGRGKNGRVVACESISLPNKLLNNEYILEQKLFKNTLEEVFAKRQDKEVTISFSMLPIVSNEYVLPVEKNRNKMLVMVKSKVFQSLSEDEYLMDYSIVREFEEDGLKKCVAMTHVVPRRLVLDTKQCILELGKKPVCFSVLQHGIFQLSKLYFKQSTIIFANISKDMVMLHLINKPDSIITRSHVISAENTLDLLSSFSTESQEITTQAYNQISKLIQYQSIKYPGRVVEAIYLLGDGSDFAMQKYLEDSVDIPIFLMDEVEIAAFDSKMGMGNYLYAYGATLEMGGKA